LTLNHQQWFAKQQKTTQFRGKIDPNLLKKGVQKLEIVEFLRSKHKISSAVAEFRVDDGQTSVSLRDRGTRGSGAYDVTERKMGLAAVLNDLHKGRDSGKAWGWVIDASAVFMTFVSLTGIVLLLFLQKRRFSGLVAGLVGAVLVLRGLSHVGAVVRAVGY